jgi:hypothetical protein
MKLILCLVMVLAAACGDNVVTPKNPTQPPPPDAGVVDAP